jgi:WXG100 family type VII secretion target
MAFSLSVSFDELRTLGQTLISEADRMTSELESLGPKADPAHCFVGQAANAYEERFLQWKAATKQAIDALHAMGPMLRSVADAMEQQNTSIAQQILAGR